MPPIADYLDQFAKVKTRKIYRAHVFAYLDSQYGPQRAGRAATDGEIARYETLAERYLTGPELPGDLARFVVSMAGTPPTTAALRFSVAIDWLGFHGHEITPRQRKVLVQRMPHGGAQTVEGDLDRDVLATILQQLDIRGRAIVLTLASSGMRIGELLQIQIRDVNLSAVPCEITIRGTYSKTGEPRVTFCSSEATDALRAWLQVRDQVVARSFGRHATLVSRGQPDKMPDNRLFPFSQHTINCAWKLALDKCGMRESDPTTRRTTLHLHMLRKFFHSQLKLGCPEEVVEALMGHRGYLSGAYRRYTKKQLAEYYAKGEPQLLVMVPSGLLDIQGRVNEQLKVQNEMYATLVARTQQQEAEIAELREAFAETREGLIWMRSKETVRERE